MLLVRTVQIHRWYGKMSTELTSHHTVRKGTAEGEYVFGGLTADNEHNAVMLRNCRSFQHYISLCMTGDQSRKESTICRSLGSFIIKEGDNIGEEQPAPSSGAAGALNTASNIIGDNPLGNAVGAVATALDPPPASDGTPGVKIEAVNGDVLITAPSGKIKLEAEDVIINCSGNDNTTGNFNVTTNNNAKLEAKQTIELTSGVQLSLKSDKRIDIRARADLNVWAKDIDFADGGAGVFGSKGAWNLWEERMRGFSAMARSATTPTHSGH